MSQPSPKSNTGTPSIADPSPTVDYRSRTANNRVSVLQRNRSLVLEGLVANVIYVAGTTYMVAFSALDMLGRERTTPALIVYTIVFVCLLMNAATEFYIDITRDLREVRHGRYSKKRSFNVAITSLFATGVIFDTVAFFLWMDRQFVAEHYVLYVSSHLGIVTAILVLVGQVPIRDTSDVMEGLDDAGNLFFLLGYIIDCFVRYLDTDFETGQPPENVGKLEFSSSPIKLTTALCYFIADALRVHRIRKGTPRPPVSTMAVP